MKKIAGIIIGLVLLFASAVQAQTNNLGAQLTPHFFYHTPGHGWGGMDDQETVFADKKRYYFDGVNDGTFDDEDALILITFAKDGPLEHEITNAYKVQLEFTRNPDGSFGTCYLYRKAIEQPTARARRARVHWLN